MNLRPLLLAVAILATSASAATITGDGSLGIDGKTYVLWGIDAPAAGQTCARGWPAGQASEQALAELTEGKTITCEPRDKDRFGRTVAVCKADGIDLAEAMVRGGMAWARLGISHGYVVQEAQAASRFLGVHSHHCEQPDVWRSRNDARQFRRDETAAGATGAEPDMR
jgi:endonuclease YncB( thermonuclease family)